MKNAAVVCLYGNKLLLFSKGGRGESFVFFKKTVEVAFIGEPQFIHDFIDAHIAVL